MASSISNQTGEQPPVVNKGQGTDALGPSDTSDSGSDITGGPGMGRDEGLDFDSGTTSDLDKASPSGTAGPDIGDANLDSDSDSSGTGERVTAGRDTPVPENRDLDVDAIHGAENPPVDTLSGGRRSALHSENRTQDAEKGPRGPRRAG